MSVLDNKIKAYLEGKPGLKAILVLMTWLLGTARARDWFARRHGLEG